jgi:hypothetical protein
MTTENSFYSEKSPVKQTVNFQCFKEIGRTGGFKPASGRGEWGNSSLIKPNK